MSGPNHNHTTKGDRGTFGETISNLSTQGTQNMEAAWSRAGASAHHTPGSATTLGSQDQTGASEMKSAHNQSFTKGHDVDPSQEPSSIGKFVSGMLNGSDKK